MVKLNIGPDIFRIPGFINVDIRFSVHPDVVMDIRKLGIKYGTASEINLGNILEHLDMGEIYKTLMECRRLLIPPGTLYITIPLIDRAKDCFVKGFISETVLQGIIKGELAGPNSHRTELVYGDIEIILNDCGYVSQELDLKTFPYMVVSDIKNPKPDPWQYGVKAQPVWR